MSEKLHANKVAIAIDGQIITSDQLPHEYGLPEQDLTLLSPGDRVWVRSEIDGIWHERVVRLVLDTRYVYIVGSHHPYSRWEVRKP